MKNIGPLRSLDELRDRLDLDSGDTKAKKSAFWGMLALSAVIAAAGVITDSTATVIGAMIIAPLSTPILGVALGVVTGSGRLVARSAATVALGAAAVVALGVVASFALYDAADIMANTQIAGRTSPRLMDLVAAVATGLAGSFAITRKDLGDVLPGVAIAISLVPPLVVVGVCLGSGELLYAFGALVLFLSNVAALIAACALVLTLSGYPATARGDGTFPQRRARIAIAAFLAIVAVPVSVNTASHIAELRWKADVRAAAEEWVAGVGGGEVLGVEWSGARMTVTVLSPTDPPPLEELVERLTDQVPSWMVLTVLYTQGERLP